YDSPQAYQAITKWSARINAAPRVPALLRRAFTLLRSGRPAPVLLELPVDIAGEEVGDFTYQPVPALRAGADPAVVREAVRLLLRARRPLLHAGQGVLWAGAWDELRQLAERLQAPVMTTLPGKSAFPEDHPLAVGTGGYSGTAVAAHFLQQADVVFGVGCSFTTTNFGAPIPPDKTILHLTNNEADLNKDVPADLALLGDAKLVLGQLIEEVDRQGGRRAGRAARQDAGGGERGGEAGVAGRVATAAHLGGDAAQPVPGPPRPDAARGPEPDDHHSRLGDAAGPARPVLGGDDAARLPGLGQVHSTRQLAR